MAFTTSKIQNISFSALSFQWGVGISFFNAEMEKVIEDMNFAMVLKFSMCRPPINVFWQHINIS